MNSLFEPETPLMRFVARLGGLITANFLFLVCCIPVFTAGAAAAALQKACQVLLYDEDDAVMQVFFRAFRQNFRQATVSYLVLLVFLAGTAFDYLLIGSAFSGAGAMAFSAVITALLILVLGIVSYLYPIMVRYDNRLMAHVKNAAVLSVLHLPRTLGMVALNLLPILVGLVSPEVLASAMAFWVVVGFAFSGYLCAVLIRPVFAELESGEDRRLRSA